MLRVSVLLQNNVKREGKFPVYFERSLPWLEERRFISPFRAHHEQMWLWASFMNVKEEIEAYKNATVISHNTAGSFRQLFCTSTILSPQESLSPSVKLRQLIALPAFLNTQVKDLSRRLHTHTPHGLESTSPTPAWRCRIYFHRDGFAARRQCVTLTWVTSDLVKLPKAPARQILIRLLLPAVPFPDECTT